ncbi:hypothetical protein D3C87_1944930 [compost metagenome]
MRDLLYPGNLYQLFFQQVKFTEKLPFDREIDQVFTVESQVFVLHKTYLPVNDDHPDDQDHRQAELEHHQPLPHPHRAGIEFQCAFENADRIERRQE